MTDIKRYELTPEEMYGMSILMDAEYIDYAYMASMGTVGVKPELLLTETRSSLSAKGLVEEDFSGEMSVSPDVEKIFHPVFFGKTETALVIARTGEKTEMETVRYHFLDDGITCTEGRNGIYTVYEASFDDMKRTVDEVFGADTEQAVSYDSGNTEMMVSVKYGSVGERAFVNVYVRSGGAFFEEKDRSFERIGTQELKKRVLGILKGEI